MTTAAAGNVARHGAEKEQGGDKEKEKMEKRRALGRGLASLLPGPRAVTPPPPPAAPVNVGTGVAAGMRAGAPAPHPGAAAPTPVSASATPSLSSTSISSPQPAGVSDHESAAADAAATGRDASAEPITIRPQEAHRPESLVANLAIADIDRNPFQTRSVNYDSALEELAESIKVSGVVQPIVVRPSDDEGRYVLILGERRLHASKKAGKTHIPAIVRRVPAQQAAEMTIVENLQREDLSPLEQAEAFRVMSTEFSLTQQQIAERVGLSRASVANYMRLLKLPITVMELLAQKSLNFAQAKELMKLEDNDRITEAAIYAVKKGMTVEQIESLVLRMDGLLEPIPGMPGVKKKENNGGARWVDPNVRAAQTDLERMLGVRVRIRDRKGKGKIVIEYSTVDDYDRVVQMLRGKN